MLQVHTQGIAEWVERWSFVSIGGGYGVVEAYYPPTHPPTHRIRVRNA